MEHATLVQLGVRWLSRQCSVVLYEAAALKKEIPDVIGWAGPRAVLIECKVSRADFLRDDAKVTRTDPKAGMAQRRYYLCPAGVVQLAGVYCESPYPKNAETAKPLLLNVMPCGFSSQRAYYPITGR
jgi:hypothetical protein